MAGLELEKQIVICGTVAYKTHIKNLVLVTHPAKVSKKSNSLIIVFDFEATLHNF